MRRARWLRWPCAPAPPSNDCADRMCHPHSSRCRPLRRTLPQQLRCRLRCRRSMPPPYRPVTPPYRPMPPPYRPMPPPYRPMPPPYRPATPQYRPATPCRLQRMTGHHGRPPRCRRTRTASGPPAREPSPVDEGANGTPNDNANDNASGNANAQGGNPNANPNAGEAAANANSNPNANANSDGGGATGENSDAAATATATAERAARRTSCKESGAPHDSSNVQRTGRAHSGVRWGSMVSPTTCWRKPRCTCSAGASQPRSRWSAIAEEHR